MDFNTKTIDSSKIEQKEPELMNSLMYGSYSANRGYGMTHEQLIKIGIGNDQMKAMYELQQQNNTN